MEETTETRLIKLLTDVKAVIPTQRVSFQRTEYGMISNSYNGYMCPRCEQELTFESKELDYKTFRYCPFCAQPIIWRAEEEE